MQAPEETSRYRDELNGSVRLALWTLAWVASLAVAKFGPGELWDSQSASWGAIALNVAVGIGWIAYYARFLVALDELQRQIQLNALAVTLGVGLVASFAYSTVDSADLTGRDLDLAAFAVLLSAVYLVAILAGHLRYR